MVIDIESRNKRLAFNTFILYGKLIISILISFLTSRLVLDALGVSDYGLYNVVGGIVAMLNILGATMVSTSYRYIAVEIGKGENGNPNKIYNTIFVIHILLAVLLLVTGETVGVYYVSNYLNVPDDSLDSALFVLHLSVLTSAVAIITVPTNGLIIAREKFLFTSLLDIILSFVKLGLILSLTILPFDRLRMYAIFLAFLQVVTPITYHIYCRIKDYSIIKWNINKNIKDYTDVIKFTSWIFIGAVASIAKVQGAAMVINLFFGIVLNAAFGLATQVYNSTIQFTFTLRQAAVPQIMKSHSAGEHEHSLNIVYFISRYSYLFMLIMAIPVIVCINGILKIWLKTPPEYTQVFIIFMLLNGLVANLGAGFDATIQASGNIKKNQIGYSIINILLIPIIYILYKLGAPPYANAIVMVVLSFCSIFFQCYIMKTVSTFDIAKYIKVTVSPCLYATLFAFLPSVGTVYILHSDSTIGTLLSVFISFLWTIIGIYVFGISIQEKKMIKNYISNIIKKWHQFY